MVTSQYMSYMMSTRVSLFSFTITADCVPYCTGYCIISDTAITVSKIIARVHNREVQLLYEGSHYTFEQQSSSSVQEE